MVAKPVKWMIDEVTYVELDGDNIWLIQDNNKILFTPTGTSARQAVDALIAVVEEAGYETPDSVVGAIDRAVEESDE